MANPLESEASDKSVFFGNAPDKGVFLARLFRHRRTSYKFFWFLALLELVRGGKGPAIPVSDVLRQMAALAWHPVCFYRLSLGSGDALQEKIRAFQATSALDNDSSQSEILSFLTRTKWATEALRQCVKYVPTRLLQAHFQPQLEGLPDQRKDALTHELAAASQKSASPSLYWLCKSDTDEIVEMNTDWANFLLKHYTVVRSFAEYELCQYLQAKNPNVPGIVNKLEAPMSRKLGWARKYWTDARSAFERSSQAHLFIDIYTREPLKESFSIDHFLPWSFVAHDLLWNLSPVASSTNSIKGDKLPRLSEHLPRLTALHHRALHMVCLFDKRSTHERLSSYAECFNLEAEAVLKLSEAEFAVKYLQVMEPQERIARFQGFSIFS